MVGLMAVEVRGGIFKDCGSEGCRVYGSGIKG